VGSLATFQNTYLVPAVLPAGTRQRLAGPCKQVEQQFTMGVAGATAVANVNTRRNRVVVFAAQRDALSAQPTLVSDFYAIDAP
jgi:hypothetical protein